MCVRVCPKRFATLKPANAKSCDQPCYAKRRNLNCGNNAMREFHTYRAAQTHSAGNIGNLYATNNSVKCIDSLGGGSISTSVKFCAQNV